MNEFRDIIGFITPYALRQILPHLKRVTGEDTCHPACTKTFTRTMGLPCAHRIQERLYDQDGGGILKLEDIHPHWRYEKPSPPILQEEDIIQEDAAEEMVVEVAGTPPPTSPPPPPATWPVPDDTTSDILHVRQPAAVKAKGRPRGSQNTRSTRQQRAFERSTQRESSGFERAPQLPTREDDAVTQSVLDRQLQPSQQGRRRGRGGGGRRGVRGVPIAGIPGSYMGSFQM